MKRSLTSVAGLVNAGLVHLNDVEKLDAVAKNFSIRVTPHVLNQIKTNDASDPIHAQYVPSPHELNKRDDEFADPIGDIPHEKVKGITHRYPDRVLLKPTHTCQVYCRFCFRREKVGHADAALDATELRAALDYIRGNTNIWEVILSGGDPLVLSDRRLESLMQELGAIDHVAVVRIHTRVPLVDPARITQQFIRSLKIRPAVYVALHVNHVRELTPEVKQALALMADNGIPLLSQTVLLKGVNDTFEALSDLMRALVANRVKPYYLHHLDKAQGVSHFRVSIAHGQRLVRELRGRLSGLCQPTYILDIPGGYGKVPIGPSYLSEPVQSSYQLTDYCDDIHAYNDPTELSHVTRILVPNGPRKRL
jgi:lysine 2,3-aminomutase